MRVSLDMVDDYPGQSHDTFRADCCHFVEDIRICRAGALETSPALLQRPRSERQNRESREREEKRKEEGRKEEGKPCGRHPRNPQG